MMSLHQLPLASQLPNAGPSLTRFDPHSAQTMCCATTSSLRLHRFSMQRVRIGAGRGSLDVGIARTPLAGGSRGDGNRLSNRGAYFPRPKWNGERTLVKALTMPVSRRASTTAAQTARPAWDGVRRLVLQCCDRRRAARADTNRLAADLVVTPDTLVAWRKWHEFNAEQALAAQQPAGSSQFGDASLWVGVFERSEMKGAALSRFVPVAPAHMPDERLAGRLDQLQQHVERNGHDATGETNEHAF